MKIFKAIIFFVFLVSFIPAKADKFSKDFSFQGNDYRVHFSVFDSTLISPAVARHHQLTRADDVAYVNIAVTQKLADGQYSLGQPAKVSGDVKNLLGQKFALNFKRAGEPANRSVWRSCPF